MTLTSIAASAMVTVSVIIIVLVVVNLLYELCKVSSIHYAVVSDAYPSQRCSNTQSYKIMFH
jgi:hypothetical protein